MKEDKLSQIINGTSALYKRYGIKSMTMDAVAKELGISKKTLYLYVSDKTDLVKKVVQLQMKERREIFNTIVAYKLNAIDSLLAVSKVIYQILKETNPSMTVDIQKYYPSIWKSIAENQRAHVMEQIKGNMAQGIEEGFYRKDMKPEIIARLFLSRFDSSEEFGCQLKNCSMTEVFSETMKYHIHGISNKKGIEYFENKLKKEPLVFLI